MSASKRDELVEKALAAFNAEGFHALGMDRIAKVTNVSKTAIYKHFKSKDELILATLRLRDEQFRNRMMRRVEEIADTPREQLLAVFEVLDDWFNEPTFQSCFFIKASSEFQSREHPIHKMAAEHKRIVTAYIEQIARDADARTPKELAAQLSLLIEGAIVLAHMNGNDESVRHAKSAAVTIIDDNLNPAD